MNTHIKNPLESEQFAEMPPPIEGADQVVDARLLEARVLFGKLLALRSSGAFSIGNAKEVRSAAFQVQRDYQAMKDGLARNDLSTDEIEAELRQEMEQNRLAALQALLLEARALFTELCTFLNTRGFSLEKGNKERRSKALKVQNDYLAMKERLTNGGVSTDEMEAEVEHEMAEEKSQELQILQSHAEALAAEQREILATTGGLSLVKRSEQTAQFQRAMAIRNELLALREKGVEIQIPY